MVCVRCLPVGGPEVTDTEGRTIGDMSGITERLEAGNCWQYPSVPPHFVGHVWCAHVDVPGGDHSFALPSWSLQECSMVNVILLLSMGSSGVRQVPLGMSGSDLNMEGFKAVLQSTFQSLLLCLPALPVGVRPSPQTALFQ